jgi:hypothetical protein
MGTLAQMACSYSEGPVQIVKGILNILNNINILNVF